MAEEHWTFAYHNLPPGEPIIGKTYRADGWGYFDPGVKFEPEAWQDILNIIGEEYEILAFSTGKFPKSGKPWVRGQLLVSPKGLDNIKNYIDKKRMH